MSQGRAELLAHLRTELDGLQTSGLYKAERVITSPQQAAITVSTGETVTNFCANNYLGLANHPALVEAARGACPRRPSSPRAAG